MLNITGLSVSFPNAPDVLCDVDLHVEAGELVALSGEPGAGKSALVEVIAGDLTPSAGSVRCDGSVAVVYQALELCDELDVAANLMLGRERHMRSESHFHAAAARELARLGIPISDTTAPVASLSLAHQRLLALAMALGRNPGLLIVDDLTANLGALASATVDRLLHEARQQGIAVVLVTRDIEQIFRLADQVVVLAHGRVAASLPVAHAEREEVAALLGEEAAIAHREASAMRRSQELQREFLSRLSHELRTPLTAIRGYATSLAAPDVDWDRQSKQRFLDRIATESARLGRLVDDLLDFSAIESGVMRLTPDWCELPLVIDAAVAVLPEDWGAAVSVDADARPLWADHDRLEQVFVNLIGNAFQHNGPDTRVQVRAFQEGADRIAITVADDGAGVAGDPFDAEHRSHSRTSGAGLGLNIARGIIEAHGGSLELAPGPGTTFRISLPADAEVPSHV
ncbi:MAG: ATP-binding cassette domain-containing protein [Solirubrobacterales bacterium]|nr:ATP-binding cassette domain-containing protein [Solirubrobacterales bacterium]